MCNLELIPLIKEYQTKNRQNFFEIYSIFEKLIFFYSRHLHDEDAISELTLFLIELLDAVNRDKFSPDNSYGLRGYIAVSIRNRYILLSKGKQRYAAACTDFCEYTASYWPDYENNLVLFEALGTLTQKQRQIILWKYLYGYSDTEIAAHLQISRQAVNRLKTRGLSALRCILEGKPAHSC